ncbi:MAG TPA: glycosyltransferase family 2 protein [Gaiellaceae bacterium]|jgi:GT2 family glycosyltransferase
MDVSVIVVTYRCRDEARDCLRALHARPPALELETIVLDNASGDGTPAMVRAEFPDVRLLELAENIGFARGVNRAAELARGEHLLLLNPDALVHPGAVERLVGFALEHPGHGLYAGKNLDPDGTVNVTSVRGLPSLWSLTCFATMLSAALPGSRLFDPESLGSWRRDSVREVGAAIGSFLLVRRSVWEALGGFDPRFFMYSEDVDLCLRAARQGRRPVFVPDAVVTHERGASSDGGPERMAMIYRGKATLLRKHWPAGKRELGLGLLWAGVGLRSLAATAAGQRSKSGPGLWRGVWRARRTWIRGYPPVAEPTPVSSESALSVP